MKQTNAIRRILDQFFTAGKNEPSQDVPEGAQEQLQENTGSDTAENTNTSQSAEKGAEKASETGKEQKEKAGQKPDGKEAAAEQKTEIPEPPTDAWYKGKSNAEIELEIGELLSIYKDFDHVVEKVLYLQQSIANMITKISNATLAAGIKLVGGTRDSTAKIATKQIDECNQALTWIEQQLPALNSAEEPFPTSLRNSFALYAVYRIVVEGQPAENAERVYTEHRDLVVNNRGKVSEKVAIALTRAENEQKNRTRVVKNLELIQNEIKGYKEKIF